MAEIDRVNSAISAFFEASGGEQDINALKAALESCGFNTAMRYSSTKMDDPELLEEITKIETDLNDLVENLPADREAAKESFHQIARRAMIARRATFPLDNPAAPWSPPTPEEALFDDNDAYAFAIFDTMAEAISELAPALYQLAVEGDYEDESNPLGERKDIPTDS